MKVTLNWLNDYVKIDDLSLDFISDKLINIGLEVESVQMLGEEIKKVYVAEIIDIYEHQNADKLCVCKVDMGDKIVTAVTGAKGFAIGDKVCMADIGATLPQNKIIEAVDLKGITSQGMLCSGVELGITNDVIDKAENKGLLILPKDAPVGKDINKYLGLDDYLLDISVTANRSDCQSVYGIARELAVVLGRELKPLNLHYKTCGTMATNLEVVIKDKDCSRYLGALIGEISMQPSPLWLRRRLYACGVSCKNIVVDITNYVLLETGQPLHAFDKKLIDKGIYVRKAHDNEEFTALNGNNYTLTKDMLLIADHGKALAIAGVMGGEQSAISDSTSEVFLESARFARGSIRKTSRKLGLHSDSSYRYEKGVDYQSIELGKARALALFYSLSVGKIYDNNIKDDTPPPKQKIIQIKYAQIKKILGIEIPEEFIKDILKKLDFSIKETKLGLSVGVPIYREDIDNFTDIIEEVIRFYGYDKLSSNQKESKSIMQGKISKRRENIDTIESLCCGIGAYEINNYSFISASHLDMLALDKDDKLQKSIEIMNPISEDYRYMRTQLVSSMLGTIHRNQVRQNKDFILFEIDNVFLTSKLPLTQLPDEVLTLCMGFCLENQDFYLVKSFITSLLDYFEVEYNFTHSTSSFLHPGISADILIDGKTCGSIGKLHPVVAKNFETNQEVYLIHLNLEPLINKNKTSVKFSSLPKYPYVERDLAVIVKLDITADEVLQNIKKSDDLVKKVELFDVYQGAQIPKNHKSLALNITLQSNLKTLTDDEINNAIKKILGNLNSLGAELRK